MKKLAKQVTKQASTHAWRGRTLRGVVAGLTYIGGMKGMSPDTPWSSLGDMFTPYVVIFLVLTVAMAATTSGNQEPK